MNVQIVTGELISLHGGKAGVTVHCKKGLLWLTTGDGCDYVVQQGQQWQLQAGVSALVEAFSDAELYLSQAEQLQMTLSARPMLGNSPAPVV